ncbi:hypothetical protein PtB15_18B258 [Puccinia triticina]|nr:hypothetical protein PtB15_18B258 [Puccinia triticina]
MAVPSAVNGVDFLLMSDLEIERELWMLVDERNLAKLPDSLIIVDAQSRYRERKGHLPIEKSAPNLDKLCLASTHVSVELVKGVEILLGSFDYGIVT